MRSGSHRLRGFSYIGLLIFIAIAAIGMTGVGIVWHVEAQREREKELLFIGDEYRRAFQSYAEATPAGQPQFPLSLDELVSDKRFPFIKRHLRKRYADPITQQPEWGLVKLGNRIAGVYSLSKKEPIKKMTFPEVYENFSSAGQYQDWRFVFTPGAPYSNGLVPHA